MNTKESSQVEAYNDDEHHSGSKKSMTGTQADEHDMKVLGKTQQLNVSMLSIDTVMWKETNSRSETSGLFPF